MKFLSLVLVTLHLMPAPVFAGEPIRFLAMVESEALAEEAILLLHCLAARADTSWEFSGEASGQHWLKVQEKNKILEGTYKRGASTTGFELRAGESDQACDKLEPTASKPEPAHALSPALSTMQDEPEAGPTRTWLWVGLGAAAAVAGFFYWKSKQNPAFDGVEMC